MFLQWGPFQTNSSNQDPVPGANGRACVHTPLRGVILPPELLPLEHKLPSRCLHVFGPGRAGWYWCVLYNACFVFSLSPVGVYVVGAGGLASRVSGMKAGGSALHGLREEVFVTGSLVLLVMTGVHRI